MSSDARCVARRQRNVHVPIGDDPDQLSVVHHRQDAAVAVQHQRRGSRQVGAGRAGAGLASHDVFDFHSGPPHAALLAAVFGSSIWTFLTFASGFAGNGTLTSRTPSEKVALTSSSLTPSGSGTAR